MSILTHGLDRPFVPGRSARISEARKVQLKGFALGTLTLLALRTAIYVWHMHG